MDENKFEWTDELVDALLESLGYTDSCDRKSTVMHFKSKQQSVSKEKDWEIVSYKNKFDGTIDDYHGTTWSRAWVDKHPIHSVRRLSDGEVFCVGDEWEWFDVKEKFKILGFRSRRNNMVVEYSGGSISIHLLPNKK